MCILLVFVLVVSTDVPFEAHNQFSVPQIEYPLGSSRTKGSHVYFLLIVAMVLLLWCQILLLWHQDTMVASEQHLYQTIVLPRKLANRKYTWLLFWYCSLVSILFKVLRILGAILAFYCSLLPPNVTCHLWIKGLVVLSMIDPQGMCEWWCLVGGFTDKTLSLVENTIMLLCISALIQHSFTPWQHMHNCFISHLTGWWDDVSPFM